MCQYKCDYLIEMASMNSCFDCSCLNVNLAQCQGSAVIQENVHSWSPRFNRTPLIIQFLKIFHDDQSQSPSPAPT